MPLYGNEPPDVDGAAQRRLTSMTLKRIEGLEKDLEQERTHRRYYAREADRLSGVARQAVSDLRRSNDRAGKLRDAMHVAIGAAQKIYEDTGDKAALYVVETLRSAIEDAEVTL